MPEHIILVDENDRPLGKIEKLKAHIEGKLHRALSIFVFNDEKKLLLQKRAECKYHSPGLWSNTCCSHPNPGETVMQAAHRRLPQEMGFDCRMKEIFNFLYKIEFKESGLYEHEYDHVLTGKYNGRIIINPEEADDYRWVNMDDLIADIKKHPGKYTYWLKQALAGFSGLC